MNKIDEGVIKITGFIIEGNTLKVKVIDSKGKNRIVKQRAKLNELFNEKEK